MQIHQQACSLFRWQDALLSIVRRFVPLFVLLALLLGASAGVYAIETSAQASCLVSHGKASIASNCAVTGTNTQASFPTHNVFPYGTCTWWANQRYRQLHGHYVPWTNAAMAWQWAQRAYQYGWHVSVLPNPGSIIVLQPWIEGAYGAGHVAIVEKVLKNAHVIASNMNWGRNRLAVTYVEFVAGPGVLFIYQ